MNFFVFNPQQEENQIIWFYLIYCVSFIAKLKLQKLNLKCTWNKIDHYWQRRSPTHLIGVNSECLSTKNLSGIEKKNCYVINFFFSKREIHDSTELRFIVWKILSYRSYFRYTDIFRPCNSQIKLIYSNIS